MLDSLDLRHKPHSSLPRPGLSLRINRAALYDLPGLLGLSWSLLLLLVVVVVLSLLFIIIIIIITIIIISSSSSSIAVVVLASSLRREVSAVGVEVSDQGRFAIGSPARAT